MKYVCVVAALLALIACSEPLEFADWTIPVPQGTRTIEYAGVPIEERTERIDLIEDLVLGDSIEDPSQAFFRPRDVVVDATGRIYVLDAGNNRIQVFGATGSFEGTIGGEGQGPGEFQSPAAIAIVGEQVVVNDLRNGRLSVWEVGGAHVADHNHGRRFRPGLMRSSANGTLLANYAGQDVEGEWRNIIAEFSLDGQELSRRAELPIHRRIRAKAGPAYPASRASAFNEGNIDGATSLATFAVGSDGRLYATAATEYQVLAFAASGSIDWALRATWRRAPFSVGEVDRTVARISSRQEEALDRSYFEWDDFLPALDELRVDGHGHLWVFPHVPRPVLVDPEAPPPVPEYRSVDVYSPDGELLFAGMTSNESWHTAFGDYVYALETNPRTEERILVRYRLAEPFE